MRPLSGKQATPRSSASMARLRPPPRFSAKLHSRWNTSGVGTRVARSLNTAPTSAALAFCSAITAAFRSATSVLPGSELSTSAMRCSARSKRGFLLSTRPRMASSGPSWSGKGIVRRFRTRWASERRRLPSCASTRNFWPFSLPLAARYWSPSASSRSNRLASRAGSCSLTRRCTKKQRSRVSSGIISRSPLASRLRRDSRFTPVISASATVKGRRKWASRDRSRRSSSVSALTAFSRRRRMGSTSLTLSSARKRVDSISSSRPAGSRTATANRRAARGWPWMRCEIGPKLSRAKSSTR